MDQLWLNLNFALASSLIFCSFLSLCLFFKLCYTFNTKMIGSALEYEEAGISKKPKLYFKQYKVNLILQCYLILTINRICYLNLFPPLFWILGAKTNKQTFSNNCPLLWSIITKYMVYNGLIHQCGKGLSLSNLP